MGCGARTGGEQRGKESGHLLGTREEAVARVGALHSPQVLAQSQMADELGEIYVKVPCMDILPLFIE